MSDGVVFDYLNPTIPAGLKLLDVPLIRANRDIKLLIEVETTRHRH